MRDLKFKDHSTTSLRQYSTHLLITIPTNSEVIVKFDGSCILMVLVHDFEKLSKQRDKKRKPPLRNWARVCERMVECGNWVANCSVQNSWVLMFHRFNNKHSSLNKFEANARSYSFGWFVMKPKTTIHCRVICDMWCTEPTIGIYFSLLAAQYFCSKIYIEIGIRASFAENEWSRHHNRLL